VGGAFCTEHGADPDIEEQLAAARERIKELEASLISIREFAEGHHQQQQGHFWLHALQVDIPEMVDVALE
jgi:outer membrane lipoprotein-sorting protein